MKVLVFFPDRPFAEKPELPEGGVYRNSLIEAHSPEKADFVMGDIPELYKDYPVYQNHAGPEPEPEPSVEDNDEERQLRDEYELLYGKKAGGRMKLETLREAVEAKKD